MPGGLKNAHDIIVTGKTIWLIYDDIAHTKTIKLQELALKYRIQLFHLPSPSVPPVQGVGLF